MKNVLRACVHICKKVALFPRRGVAWLIRVYQKTLSLDHGVFKHRYPHGYCLFTPTCSQYGHDAILKYGVFRGGVMAAWRILRCNPCSRGGVDPVE